MSFMDNLLGKPATTFDPYAQDRAVRMDLLKRSMGDYDTAMAQPLGFLSPSMKNQVLADAETGVRNQYQGQGQGGFVNDRIARAKNDALMKMTQQNLSEADKQRQYMQQLGAMSQGQQYQPAQEGLLSQLGGQFLGQAGQSAGGMAVNALGGAMKKMFSGGDNSMTRGGGQPEFQGTDENSLSDQLRSRQGY